MSCQPSWVDFCAGRLPECIYGKAFFSLGRDKQKPSPCGNFLVFRRNFLCHIWPYISLRGSTRGHWIRAQLRKRHVKERELYDLPRLFSSRLGKSMDCWAGVSSTAEPVHHKLSQLHPRKMQIGQEISVLWSFHVLIIVSWIIINPYCAFQPIWSICLAGVPTHHFIKNKRVSSESIVCPFPFKNTFFLRKIV